MRLQRLHRLAASLSEAATSAAMFEAALECLHDLVAPDRSALMIADDDGRLWFRTWRGLSESYRAAVDGQQPWPTGALRPLAVNELPDDPRAAHHREHLQREGIGALAFAPMTHDRRLLGAIALYRDAPSSVTGDDLEIAQAVASHLAAAVHGHTVARRLRRSEDELHVILRRIGEAITVQRPDGSFQFANEAAAAFLGFDSPEALQRAAVTDIMARYDLVDELGDPFPAERLPSRVAATTLREVGSDVWFRVRATGEMRCSELSSAPVLADDGRLRFVINIFRDVTETRRAARGARFLAEASAALSQSLDYRTTLEQVARMAIPTMADWCAVDLIAPDQREIERVVVHHRDPAKVELARALRERYPPDLAAEHGTARVLRTGQGELYAEITDDMLRARAQDEEHYQAAVALGLRSAITAPLMARGRCLGTITFVNAESARRYTEGDLEIAVDLGRRAGMAIENARLFEAQREARQRAAAAERRKDEFLAILGHELRNPLAPIRTALELMRMKDDAAFLREREIVERQLGYMMRLVDDLLDLSRITRGKLELRREDVELSDCVRDAIEVASPSFDARRHQLVVNVADDLHVRGDRVRLAQVIANLLTNAAKYTDPGGRVELVARRDGDQAVISVTDNGIGLAAEDPDDLFELFVRGGRDDGRSGLGLGLTIVRRLVELHGGEVSARSDGPGRGSTFEVRLPYAPPRTTRRARTMTPDGRASVARRVLIVDDNRDAADLLALALQHAGHTTAVAEDGPAALALAESFHPDVALLDIGLPVMDGYDLARRLRATDSARNVRLIAITGYGQAHDREQALAAGFDAHFVKPVDVRAITRSL